MGVVKWFNKRLPIGPFLYEHLCHYYDELIIKAILDMVYNSKASHVGSALSVVDIITVLYNDIIKDNAEAES